MRSQKSAFHNTVLGVPVVTIPLADYADLLSDQRQLHHGLEVGRIDEDGRLSMFTVDPEMAIFVASRFGVMTASEIVSACKAVFGEERTPLILEVQRFWMRMRRFLPPHIKDMAV